MLDLLPTAKRSRAIVHDPVLSNRIRVSRGAGPVVVCGGGGGGGASYRSGRAPLRENIRMTTLMRQDASTIINKIKYINKYTSIKK